MARISHKKVAFAVSTGSVGNVRKIQVCGVFFDLTHRTGKPEVSILNPTVMLVSEDHADEVMACLQKRYGHDSVARVRAMASSRTERVSLASQVSEYIHSDRMNFAPGDI